MRTFIALLFVALPTTASANIGLPMVAIFLPPMWLALIAIIGVEAFLIARMAGTTFRRAVVPVTYGNLVSTLVGIPLVWFLLALGELVCCGSAKGLATAGAKLYAVTVQAPWLIPYEEHFHWMIPAALAVLLVPFLAASVVIEAPFNKRLLADVAKGSMWRATTFANIGSYACLALLMAGYFAIGDHVEWIGRLFTPLINWIIEAVFRVATALASN